MVTIQAKKCRGYGVKHFIVDTVKDFDLIKRDLLYIGSTAFVISTGDNYIVDGSHNWVLVPRQNSSTGGSGEGSDGDMSDTIIYDGGEIL